MKSDLHGLIATVTDVSQTRNLPRPPPAFRSTIEAFAAIHVRNLREDVFKFVGSITVQSDDLDTLILPMRNGAITQFL